MSDLDYERWWALHLRVAKNEPLSQGEQADYEAGLRQFEETSAAPDAPTLSYLRALRASITRAATHQAELAVRSRELDREIARLESSYQQMTGETLDVEPHAQA
ncbi:MAG: hypothetical protein KDD83_21020 [Caldilineaceae bacterium]|nr:hypothetical protein [Caldilineaceae bacterium]